MSVLLPSAGLLEVQSYLPLMLHKHVYNHLKWDLASVQASQPASNRIYVKEDARYLPGQVSQCRRLGKGKEGLGGGGQNGAVMLLGWRGRSGPGE